MSGYPNSQGNPASAIPVYSAGAALVVPVPPTPFPATIAATTTYTTGIMSTMGLQGIAASAQINQTGVLTLQRYIDTAGTIPIGAALTQAMTSGVLATVAVRDGLPAASFSVSIQNTSGSTATLTNAAILATG